MTNNSKKNNISGTVINTIASSGLVFEGSCVVVGFSGGPDSLCLLHALNELSDSMQLNLFPVHINHKLRGAKSDSEAENAAKICEKMDLQCFVFEADCKKAAEEMGVSEEEAGRVIRYQVFDEVAEEMVSQGVDPEKIYIALAHNADDQSETVLFRLMRGTGVHGLAGIPAVRFSTAGFCIVRPLIDITRSDIEAYIAENKLHPNMDESNEVADVTRNKIRLKLIPYLEKNYNPNVKEALRRFAKSAEYDDHFMNEVATGFFYENTEPDTVRDALVLKTDEFIDAHIAIQKRVIMLCLEVAGIQEVSSYELVTSILELAYSSNPSARVDLPMGLVAQREYESIVFMSSEFAGEKSPAEEYRIMPQVMQRKEFENVDSDVYAAFDYDAFNEKYPGKVGEICLRTRREGDFIAMKGGKSKKLQDFFVDAKIVQSERDSILLVAIGSEILWIVPDNQLPTASQRDKGRFSQNYQIKDTTERVLFLELIQAL